MSAVAYPQPARLRHRPLSTALTVSAAAYQAGVRILKFVAAVLAGATVALAVMNYLDARQPASTPEAVAVEPVQNETVVYRQLPPKSQARPTDADESASSAGSIHTETEVPASYSRAVQTVRFSNPSPGPATYALASATSEPVVEPAMPKIGGFIALPAKEAAIDPPAITGAVRPDVPRKRPTTVMGEVDEYLWEVYQRAPVKRDSSGDFSWKDPAAAQRVGLSLREYVIVGMDPDFREQLYHAGKAMDAAGLQWSMLSAFRDDYRQKLASGFKASGGNSLHGGSSRTGGYGHGRAIDITNADGDAYDVWKWIDAHGAKYGLNRPMPGADPAHIQQKGDWHKIAVALRTTRGVTLLADASTATVKETTGSVKETTGRRHRVRFARAR